MTGNTLELGGSPGSFNDFVEKKQAAEPDADFTRSGLLALYTQGLAAFKVECEAVQASQAQTDESQPTAGEVQ